MTLRLYNTLTKTKEIFEPVTPGQVGIYLCGPTVYKESHIGHAVGPVIFDALKRYLCYKGYQVKLIINITDVDDKLILESQKQGVEIKDLAEQVSASYFQAMEELGVNGVDEYPRATESIDDIIALVAKLIEQDAAYEVEGDVYFDITRSKDYGKLSNRSREDQMEGTRDLAGAGKRHHDDFALWKKAGEGEIGWDCPWGRGRPGWHIECSAMSMRSLGETFDIHGGGMDLIFPHHENEIAQSECATGKPYVKYWMHNGLTRIKTKQSSGQWSEEKMSKSLGNIRTLSELFKVYPGAVIRFFLLSTHYRRPIDFSDESIEAVQKGLKGIHRLLGRVSRLTNQDVFSGAFEREPLEKVSREELVSFRDTLLNSRLRYMESLDDDFNTAGAIAVLFDLSNSINRFIDQYQLELQMKPAYNEVALLGGRCLVELGRILGLLDAPLESAGSGPDRELVDQLMAVFIELRNQARKDKNFALADAIRDKLKAMDIVLEDRPEGTLWTKG